LEDALLQGGIELAEGERRRFGTEGAEGVEPHLVGRDADLQSFQIGWRPDRIPFGGDVAESVFPPRERDDVLGIEQLRERGAELSVEGPVGMLARRPGVGQLDDAEFRLDRWNEPLPMTPACWLPICRPSIMSFSLPS
jgi:hypothetical protein